MTLLPELAFINGEIRPGMAIGIDVAGTIVSVRAADGVAGERIAGLLAPGLANLHAHSFQRGMAGLAEGGGRAGDDFWRWREVMYRFLALLTPEDVEAIAAQLQLECLLHGYTAIAEFHYLHNAPDGSAYDDRAELSRRILAAAATSGIGLTLLPVLYRRSGFGGQPALPAQHRFVLDVDDHARLCADLASDVRLGVAPHSLRAVTLEELAGALALAEFLGADTPVHIHVAEQEAEVAACLAWSGQRPVEWLLAHAQPGPAWCLVHATHMTPGERSALAGSGAVAGLCPSTEANLGDGIFPFRDFLHEGGRFGIGSDSNVSTSPAEELRWLDYVGRLQARRRTEGEGSVAASLLTRAAEGGAQALGRPAGAIAPGRRADFVALDTDHPSLVGRAGLALLDSWVFSGNATPVRDVMVDGSWVVCDRVHHAAGPIGAAFARSMRRIAALL